MTRQGCAASTGALARTLVFARTLAFTAIGACLAPTAHGGATSFAEPPTWNVGDIDSTFQQWIANPLAPFAPANTAATDANANPAIAASPAMGVDLPGFPAGSGGYYSFGGTYGVYATVYNHAGTAGAAAPYPADYGTRVVIQTASTMNGPDSVFAHAVQIVALDGSSVAGGCNSCMLESRELFVGDVESSIGIVPQQELRFEFWLPSHTSDFRVELDVVAHSSFQHLRIDSHIESPPPLDPDFDRNAVVDGADFLAWQRCLPVHGDAAGLAVWTQAYGAPAAAPASIGVPEPPALWLAATTAAAFVFWRSTHRRLLAS